MNKTTTKLPQTDNKKPLIDLRSLNLFKNCDLTPAKNKTTKFEEIASFLTKLKTKETNINTLRNRYIEVLKKSYLRMYKAKYLKFPKNIFSQTQKAKFLDYKDLRCLSIVVQSIALKYSKNGIFEYLKDQPTSIFGGNIFLQQETTQKIGKVYLQIINRYCSKIMDQTTLFFALKLGDCVTKVKKVDEIKIFTYAFESERGCFPDPKEYLIWVPVCLCYNQKEFMITRESKRMAASCTNSIVEREKNNGLLSPTKVSTTSGSRFSISPMKVVSRRSRILAPTIQRSKTPLTILTNSES